jgi:hypothetical protein
MKKRIWILPVALAIWGVWALHAKTASASSASATGSALQRVIAALSIVKDADLNFGEAAQGAAAKTIAPAAADKARFTVSGEPGKAFNIVLPADSTVKMITDGGGSANKEIAVNAFTSFPATQGTLSGAGSLELGVGATRAALGASQQAGNYSGSFVVTVAY